jgi:hypothetical protein
MNRRLFATVISTALAWSLLMPVNSVMAAGNAQCQGGPEHWSGATKTASAGNSLTQVRATLDKQVAPLCKNVGLLKSHTSWWIMIAQNAQSANDFIQYGFWNCQTWCNFGWPGGETGGQQHEYYERNNGNWDGNWRIDLGNVTNGVYTLKMVYSGGQNAKWSFYRGGVLRAQHSDSFRDWSLVGARFELLSESWDAGDQNGGSVADKVNMTKAGWGLNLGGVVNIGLGGCSGNSGVYHCTKFDTNVTGDSLRTWTDDR